MLDGRTEACGELSTFADPFRRWIAADRKSAPALNMSIERDLIALMPPSPPSLPIPNLVYRDSVDPGPQRRLPSEPVNRSKNLQKDLLGQIQRLAPVTEEMVCKAEHHSIMLGHEECARVLITRRATLDQRAFAVCDFVQPRTDGLVHPESPGNPDALCLLTSH
jgi:hypothetical protein